ncbi:MAG: DUF2878 domain-containing protein [Pseudohongiellaceae bacterium]
MAHAGAPVSTSAPQRWQIILNAAVFQVAWLACVTGGTTVALAVTATVLGLHLWWSSRTGAEAAMLLAALLVGLVCETVLIQAGVLRAPGPLPPVWLLCLWPLFAATLGLALRWFRDRPACAAAGGLLFAPLSYFGGSRLAGIELLTPEWLALILIGTVWLFAFPLLTRIHRRLLP